MLQTYPLCHSAPLACHISQSPSDRGHSGKPKLPGLLGRDGHTTSKDDPIRLPSGMTSVKCRRGHACPRMALHVKAAWCRRLGAGGAHPRREGCWLLAEIPERIAKGQLGRASRPRNGQVNSEDSLGCFSPAHSALSHKESKTSVHVGPTHSNRVHKAVNNAKHALKVHTNDTPT